MSFSTRRGRPPKPRLISDLGTPELQEKRAAGITIEAMDLCLERKLIDRDQHWAGLHLRWLYTLRYGAPSISSHWWRLTSEGRSSPRCTEADSWRRTREEDYAKARELLNEEGTYEPVMNLAVFNETPSFLKPGLLHRAMSAPSLLARIEDEKNGVNTGLTSLVRLWRNHNRAPHSTYIDKI